MLFSQHIGKWRKKYQDSMANKSTCRDSVTRCVQLGRLWMKVLIIEICKSMSPFHMCKEKRESNYVDVPVNKNLYSLWDWQIK